MERPVSLVILGVVAVTLVVGTFALLIDHVPVPEPIWVAWGVVITALYGHGNFLAQAAGHARTVSDLLDAVQTGATAATPGPGTTISNGPTTSTPAGGETGHARARDVAGTSEAT